MSDETTLLPCICGGKASLKVLEYGDGCKVWGVFCESDLASEYSHGHFIDNYATEAEAIAAWNTRATHSTLTAEQVREATKSNSRKYKSPVDDGIWIKEYDWQAIADELNARAERTCRIVEYADAPIPVCSECGAVQPDDYAVYYCWSCGAKVRDE